MMTDSAIMRILGWKAQGLRCPDHEIKCSNGNDEPFPVTLIQMPNGTGKTTTLELLRAALSGSASDNAWDRNKVLEMKKRDSEENYGYFELILLLNRLRTTIRMDFDFENETVSYKTTNGHGKREGFHSPSLFRRFMNKNFVNFYVFDGELAQHLIDHESTDAQVVVEHLFQMNVFDLTAKKVTEYWDQKAKNSSATEKRGLSRRRNRLSYLRNHLASLEKNQKELLGEYEKMESDLKKTKDEYNHEIKKEENREKVLNHAENEVAKLKGRVREEALDVLDRMRDPHALSSSFTQSLLAFKDGLDRVKLPESAAKEFFVDLSTEDECICGRPIDSKIAETILTRAGQYLGSDDVSLLNSMKASIKDAIGDIRDSAEKDLTSKIDNLALVAKQEQEAMNSRDAIKYEAEQANPSVKNARDKIERLKKEIKKVSDNLEKFNSEDESQNDERTFGIEIIRKRIEKAEKDLAEITDTLAEKAKRDIITKILDNAHKKARHAINTELCNQANSRISELMPNNNISIDRIEQNLILEGQEGGSVGETLSIAYAFLATLFNRSEHKLPFVVDSPAGPIDLAVRPKIGELIPNLTKQFIAFTISSERSGFIDPLKRACNAEVCFITLFRKGSYKLQVEDNNDGEVSETTDGMIISGEKFFNSFQLDEEGTT